jgi:hypothetical protein
MKENSSMDFPQHGEVFYFYGQALIQTIRYLSILKNTETVLNLCYCPNEICIMLPVK